MAKRGDPYFGFQFRLELQGVFEGGFAEVSGLAATTQVEDFREGGVNDYTHKFPKETTFDNLVLKRGLADTRKLWQWHLNVVRGKIERTTITIVLQDKQLAELHRWSYKEAYPVKWTGPEIKADSNTVAFETLEFAHHGYAE
ncbi:MAG: phage tail protein [bacterium]